MLRRLLGGAALVLLTMLAVPAIRHWRETPPPPPQPLRASWAPVEALTVGSGGDHPFGLALSADGRQLAYPAARNGRIELWLHDLATNETRALPSTGGAASPFWSADGKRIGFFTTSTIQSIDLEDGAVTALADAPAGRGATWNAAGDLVFAPTGDAGLMLRTRDGVERPLTTVDAAQGESSHRWPAFLPDGRHVVFFVRASARTRGGIWLTSLDAPASRERLASADSQAIVAGQTLLYANDAALMAQPLDPSTWKPAGRATLAGSPVGRGPLDQLFATAASEVLLYGPPGTTLRELRWLDRDGVTTELLGEPADAWDLRVSPDGQRVALTELDAQLRTLDVWIRESHQPVATRLSVSADVDESGVWSPDGLRIAWTAARQKVTIRGAGAVLPEQVVATYDPPVQVWDWTRDGRALVIGRTAADSRDDLWILPLATDAVATPYTTEAFNQIQGVVSPDGRALAYASDESGKFDVYIDTFPTPGARVRVTTAGGAEPRWRGDGRELYFRRGSEVHAVAIEGARGRVALGASARLFDAGASIRAYDAAPDGRRFLLNLPAAGTAPLAATLVVNSQPRP